MEAGEGKLNKIIQYGDRLLPDTAAAGRDVIRQELTIARALWHKLVETFAERKRVQDSEAEAKKACVEDAARLDTWLTAAQRQIGECSEVHLDALDAKKNHMKTMKVSNNSNINFWHLYSCTVTECAHSLAYFHTSIYT